MSIEFSIHGDKEVMAKLADLRGSIQKRLVEGAGRAALKPVVADVRARCPVNSGTLKRSIGTKKAKRPNPGEVVLSVGARPGYGFIGADGKKHNPFFYAIPLEYGHSVKFSKDGPIVGHVAPVGMFRAAYDRNRESVIEDFGEELKSRIEEYMQ